MNTASGTCETIPEVLTLWHWRARIRRERGRCRKKMLEEIMTKDLLNFVKDMGTNFSYEWAQNGKIFMFHADAHQRTSTAEETLHNMDKIKCLSTERSPQCLLNQWCTKWARLQGWQRHTGLTTWTSPDQSWLSYCYCQGSNLPTAEPNPELWYGRFPKWATHPPSSKLISLHSFHHGGGSNMSSLD